MPKASPNGTPVYARQQSRAPTPPQLNAIDLLAAGKTDQATAEAVRLHRTTVTKWRLYDPVFHAALKRRRAEVWGAAADRLRSLIPKALDALAAALDDPAHPHRLKAAGELLRLAPPTGTALSIGPTDPEAIVQAIVRERRNNAPGGLLDDWFDGADKGLPPQEQHVEQVWAEMEARALESEPAPTAAG